MTVPQPEEERLPSNESAQARARPRLSGLGHFLAELKRRRVIRALLGYAVVSFAILQVVEPVMHGLHLPDSTLSVVVIVIGLGFPVTVALAWVFDLTWGGVRRTRAAARPELRGPRLVLLILGLGLLAGAPGVSWFLLRHGGARSAGEAESAPPVPTTPSVAVLAFADMSPGKDQEYFADGFAEEILNALAQVEGLKVSGRTSSFSFRGTNRKLAEIGRELGVGAVLEGSVRKAGDRIRITAHLVKTTDGFHVWSQTFDRDLSDVFAVQDEIARAVVEALRLKLLPAGGPGRGTHTASQEAYDQYLLGRDLERSGDIDRMKGALAAFERATSLDGSFAPAWAGAAGALMFIEGMAGEGTSPEQRHRALAAADRAIALAPDLPDGYAVRARIRSALLLDWEGARADAERARALGPSDVLAIGYYGRALMELGRLQGALPLLERATEIDPLSARAWAWLGRALVSTDQHERGRAALRRALRISPRGEEARYYLFADLVAVNEPAQALAEAEQATLPWIRLTGVALAQYGLGQSEKSQAALEALIQGSAADAAYQVAEVHAWRGETEQAFAWLERARVQADTGLAWIKSDPLLQKIRGDPRYAGLLRKLNLPTD
jgi:TolB-like protein/tetratricopeptide (TPR) repeat protein